MNNSRDDVVCCPYLFFISLTQIPLFRFVGTVTGDKIHMTMKKDGVEDYGDAELALVHSET
jgi:hypothetical protein